MTRRKCPAARRILLELAADREEASFRRTRSRRAYERMRLARIAAMCGAAKTRRTAGALETGRHQ